MKGASQLYAYNTPHTGHSTQLDLPQYVVTQALTRTQLLEEVGVQILNDAAHIV